MSRSLTRLASVKSRVDPAIRAAGFVPDRGFFRREAGGVACFFDWQRPYDNAGMASVDPLLCAGSPEWQRKVGIPLEVRPGATQLSVRLAVLAQGGNPSGYPISAERWEETAARIVEEWRSCGLPFLEALRTTDDLVRAVEEHPPYSNKTLERDRWEARVWRDETDPTVEPFRPTPPEAERVWSRDELMGERGAS